MSGATSSPTDAESVVGIAHVMLAVDGSIDPHGAGGSTRRYETGVDSATDRPHDFGQQGPPGLIIHARPVPVAQRTEQPPSKRKVAGSNPAGGAIAGGAIAGGRYNLDSSSGYGRQVAKSTRTRLLKRWPSG